MKRVLTGVKPTGIAHLGNYFGAIKPAIELSKNSDYECYYFIADYHALTTVQNQEELFEYTYHIACTWLACGLDPNKVVLYKQSDVPQTFELSTILSNLTPKGLMNRAHAYKAKVEANEEAGEDKDYGINMGLYTYPILMAADILLLGSDFVPVGLDQKQHVEIARDIAAYFNKKYGNTFSLPEELISENVGALVGLDGRKMSKSYGNVIPIFADEAKLKKLVNRIVTDSTAPDEPKSLDNTIYKLYKLFGTEEQAKAFAQKLQKGVSWGEAKTELFNLMNAYLSPMREKYNYLKQHREIVDEILRNGAQKARELAKQTIQNVRKAIGVVEVE